VVYVMQDGGALRLVLAHLRGAARGGLAGGDGDHRAVVRRDLETVTVHTGLLAARHVLGPTSP